jgi:hypothetical protein
MKNNKKNRKKSQTPKTRLRLPDLDQAKAAVLLSLRSPESPKTSIGGFVRYGHNTSEIPQITGARASHGELSALT